MSFDIRWSNNLDAAEIHNALQRFQGSFRHTAAVMSCSVQQEGFRFESADTSISVSAVIGRERNGIFFTG